jgi:hypothetical protein
MAGFKTLTVIVSTIVSVPAICRTQYFVVELGDTERVLVVSPVDQRKLLVDEVLEEFERFIAHTPSVRNHKIRSLGESKIPMPDVWFIVPIGGGVPQIFTVSKPAALFPRSNLKTKLEFVAVLP